MRFVLAALLMSSGFAQTDKPAIASNPVVTLKGTVQKVQLAQGRGMPYLEVQGGGEVVKVYLGSVRYLMEQGFNPKAGAEVTVKGYKMNPDVIAITVTIASEKKTLKLRDDDGWPLWRGGMMRGGGRH